MKNLIITAFTFMFLVTATALASPAAPATAGEPLIVRSHLAEGGLELMIANLEQETAVITLTSLTTNRVLFNDRIRKHNGYSYNINLDELHYGRYVLAVKKGDTVRKQVILVNGRGVACSEWK